MNIKILNPVFSQTNEPEKLETVLCFTKEFWRQSGFKRTRREYQKLLVDKKGIFLTGFVGRICREFNVQLNKLPSFKTKKPNLPGIELREDQFRLIEAAVKEERGILKAPTGSGKTLIAAGIISCYLKDTKILFLCHTIDLVEQSIEEFNRFNLGKISKIAEGKKDLSGRIVIATIQSFSNLDMVERDIFDVIIVDEAHHCIGKANKKWERDTLYYKTLTTMTAPVRIGLTATLPSSTEDKLILEGLIGEVIGEVSLDEGIELGILAVPKVELVKINSDSGIRDLKKYSEIYEAVTSSRARNRVIVNKIKELNERGLTTLTYVSRIEHGESLTSMMSSSGVPVEFIYGATESEYRTATKHLLINKELINVVATVVWKEGLNIPSLGAILIAGGGKGELALLQTIGRGLRRTKDKSEVIIVDFLDPVKYMSEHCIERIGVYIENGWIK